MMGTTRRAVLAAAGLAAPFVVRAARAQAARTVSLGGSIPMTGAAAETGLNVLHGYQTAVKRIEEMGGIQAGGATYRFELRLVDDASDPSRAVTLIQRQVDEQVPLFLGSFGSNIILPTCAITERARRPMVQAGGGSDQIFTQGRRFVFGVFPRATRQFETTTDFFKALDPKPRTFAILYTNDPFSRFAAEGAKTSLTNAGFQVSDPVQLPAVVTDVTTVLARIRETQPDVLVANTHDEHSLLITRQMISSNTNVKLAYFGLGPQTAAYRQAIGRYAEGILTSSYWAANAPYDCPYFGNAKGFEGYYNRNFQRPLAYHMASGAACILAFAEALKAAGGPDPAKLRDALAAMDFSCFYGRIKFTPQGDGDANLMGPLVAQVQRGALEIVSPQAAATARAIWPVPPWNQRG
jgi:branched-chain amino acid transport system substrate-binding protein